MTVQRPISCAQKDVSFNHFYPLSVRFKSLLDPKLYLSVFVLEHQLVDHGFLLGRIQGEIIPSIVYHPKTKQSLALQVCHSIPTVGALTGYQQFNTKPHNITQLITYYVEINILDIEKTLKKINYLMFEV